MIKKNEETGKESTKISSFKKFSELSGSKKQEVQEDPHSSALPETEGDRPAVPNLPYKKSKGEQFMSTNYMMPSGQTVDSEEDESSDKAKNEDVKFYGKVAKLPKGVKASKGFNFLENVKVSKSSIWYIMVERQDNELQMVKYNYKKGVDLVKFVTDLKEYYCSKYSDNEKIVKMIEGISIDGNDKYSWVKDIPLVEVDGRKMISIITEDLIKLLSK
jgi:hypothetical protein